MYLKNLVFSHDTSIRLEENVLTQDISNWAKKMPYKATFSSFRDICKSERKRTLGV